MGDIENGAIVGCFIGAVGEEKVSAGVALSCWFVEIGCITANAKDHVAFGVGENGVRKGGDIVKEVMGSLHGVLSGCGLGGGKRAEGNQNGSVDSAVVVKLCAYYLLDAFLVLFG